MKFLIAISILMMCTIIWGVIRVPKILKELKHDPKPSLELALIGGTFGVLGGAVALLVLLESDLSWLR